MNRALDAYNKAKEQLRVKTKVNGLAQPGTLINLSKEKLQKQLSQDGKTRSLKDIARRGLV